MRALFAQEIQLCERRVECIRKAEEMLTKEFYDNCTWDDEKEVVEGLRAEYSDVFSAETFLAALRKIYNLDDDS